MAQIDPKRLARYKAEMEAQEARQAERKTFVKTNLFKPPLNKPPVLIRILPGQDPGSLDKDYVVEIWQHFVAGIAYPITCPRTLNADAECPICAKVRQLYSTKNEQDKTIANKMKAKPRFMLSVVPLQGFEDDVLGKIAVWPAPGQVNDRIQNLFNNPDYGDITHPTEGFDCWLTVTGQDMNIKYNLDPVRNPSPLSDDPDELALVLQAQPALYKYRFAADADQLRKLILGETTSITQHVDPNEKAAAAHTEVDEEESVFTPVATGSISAPSQAAAPKPSPVLETPFDAPAPAPAPAAAPKRAKFDVSAIKAQVANIRANGK